MTKTDVMALLRSNRNERGIKNWKKMEADTKGLKSFGIGLTQLRKLAKQIGRNHTLALQLWETKNHDAKIIGLLIDEPKRLSREQVEKQVEEIDVGMLEHVFSSCDATLARAPFVFDLTCNWIKSNDPRRRRCGYGLVYELSKNQKMQNLTDQFFSDCIEGIRKNFDKENTLGRMSMGSALMGIGKRNKKLNKAAVRLARKLGPIDFKDNKGNCEPFDIVKHLTSGYLKKKLEI